MGAIAFNLLTCIVCAPDAVSRWTRIAHCKGTLTKSLELFAELAAFPSMIAVGARHAREDAWCRLYWCAQAGIAVALRSSWTNGGRFQSRGRGYVMCVGRTNPRAVGLGTGELQGRG